MDRIIQNDWSKPRPKTLFDAIGSDRKKNQMDHTYVRKRYNQILRTQYNDNKMDIKINRNEFFKQYRILQLKLES